MVAVAPSMSAPLRCHWVLSGAVPLAATVKLAGWPVATLRSAGCWVMAGATAGAGPEHVVKVNVYLTDVNDRAKINPARQRYFGAHRPASTLVGVTALVLPAAKVEIEATAVVP